MSGIQSAYRVYFIRLAYESVGLSCDRLLGDRSLNDRSLRDPSQGGRLLEIVHWVTATGTRTVVSSKSSLRIVIATCHCPAKVSVVG